MAEHARPRSRGLFAQKFFGPTTVQAPEGDKAGFVATLINCRNRHRLAASEAGGILAGIVGYSKNS
jgi:hypothetical protein